MNDPSALFDAIHHTNLAHGRGVAALRANAKDLIIGVINNLGPVALATPSAEDREAARWCDALRVHDDNRIGFLADYLGAVRDAIAAGVDVKGYFVWSLLDNFEWAYGYAKRFGIAYVDYSNLTRTPKKSFDYYRSVVRANAVLPANEQESPSVPPSRKAENPAPT